MAGRAVSQELLNELDAAAGAGPRQGHEDPDAYRLGRSATRVTPSLLSAKLRQFDDKISAWILVLTARSEEFKVKGRHTLTLAGHGIAILAGFLVLAAAFGVDFMIIQEFWKRVLANEFGEVPASLATNLLFKSAQVLFATLAFHFMLETVGETGRKVFIWFIFALTFCMLLGIGLIIAKDWLPPGSTLYGIKMGAAVETADNVLQSLGLGGNIAAQAPSAAGPVTEEGVKTLQTFVWLGSLSVIFIIVTGVGSLCMGVALRGFRGIFGDLTFDPRAGGAAQLVVQRDEEARILAALGHFQDPKARWLRLQKHLSDFVTSYFNGVRAYETAWFGIPRQVFKRDTRARELLLDLEQAVQMVESEWTLDYVRERHPPIPRSSTNKDGDEDRVEPRMDGGEQGNVFDLKRRPLFGRRSGGDE